MKRKNFILGAFSLALLSGSLLTGCGKKGGDEYLGKWEDKDRHSTTMTIEKNGDGYLINMVSKRENASGEHKTASVPATMKDGVLNYPNGPATGTVTYVKASDSLLMSSFIGTMAFERAK